MLRVDASVDDEANGTPDVAFKAAVVRIGILVEADIFAEAFGVQSPAFAEGGVAAEFAKLGNAFLFPGDGDLQMMAGQAFVIAEIFDLVKVAVVAL